jgi:hypothetical protein
MVLFEAGLKTFWAKTMVIKTVLMIYEDITILLACHRHKKRRRPRKGRVQLHKV